MQNNRQSSIIGVYRNSQRNQGYCKHTADLTGSTWNRPSVPHGGGQVD